MHSSFSNGCWHHGSRPGVEQAAQAEDDQQVPKEELCDMEIDVPRPSLVAPFAMPVKPIDIMPLPPTKLPA